MHLGSIEIKVSPLITLKGDFSFKFLTTFPFKTSQTVKWSSVAKPKYLPAVEKEKERVWLCFWSVGLNLTITLPLAIL